MQVSWNTADFQLAFGFFICFINRRDVSKTYRAYFFFSASEMWLIKNYFLEFEAESSLVC